MLLFERLRHQIRVAMDDDYLEVQAVCAARTVRDALSEIQIATNYMPQPASIYGFSVRVMSDLPDGVWVLAMKPMSTTQIAHGDYVVLMGQVRAAFDPEAEPLELP